MKVRRELYDRSVESNLGKIKWYGDGAERKEGTTSGR